MFTTKDFERFTPGSSGMRGFVANKEPHPGTYLRFAKEDLADGHSPRHRVNAVSNAKRALHLQVELTTDALGYARWTDSSPTGFPRRLQFLRECDLIAPGLLSKINKARNMIEHKYLVPDIDDVLDYVEIVDLYLLAAAHSQCPEHQEIRAGKSPNAVHCCLVYSHGSGKIDLFECSWEKVRSATSPRAASQPESVEGSPFVPAPLSVLTLDIAMHGDDYFQWLKLMMPNPRKRAY